MISVFRHILATVCVSAARNRLVSLLGATALVVISIAGCYDNAEPAGDPEPPDPQPVEIEEVTLWVEADYVARTKSNEGGGAQFDLVPWIVQWPTYLVGEWGAFDCGARYDEHGTLNKTRKVQIRFWPSDTAEEHWSENTLVDQAAIVFNFEDPNDFAHLAAILLALTKEGRVAEKIPNLHVIAAEHYFYDSTEFSYPSVLESETIERLLIVRGVTMNADTYYLTGESGYVEGDDYNCQFEADRGFPASAVFVREIEKLVKEMNTYMSSCSGSPPYDLNRMVKRALYHELYHELYVASPDHYDDDPETACHDNDCTCIMNSHSYGRVVDIRNAGGPFACQDAQEYIENSQSLCIEGEHELDGCTWSALLTWNQ